MSEYIVLLYEDPTFYENLPPEGWGGVIEAHNKFREQVSELGGSLTGGGALAPVTTATTITRDTVSDGPAVQTKETFNGYYTFEARDLDHAIDIAKQAPAPSPTGRVELRPLVDPSTSPF